MEFALVQGTRVKATLEAKGAVCPICKGDVHAKCGRIKVWHFAHEAREDCDLWSEPDSVWHHLWQTYFGRQFGDSCLEVIVSGHRADVRLPNGIIIEVQNSGISVDDIEERERCYEKMVWLLNGDTLGNGIRFRDVRDKRKGILTFRWKRPRWAFFASKRPIYIDLGMRAAGVFSIRNVRRGLPCGGWGEIMTRETLFGYFGRGICGYPIRVVDPDEDGEDKEGQEVTARPSLAKRIEATQNWLRENSYLTAN